MNPNQMLDAIYDSLRLAIEAVPDTFVSEQPDAAYREMTVHMVRELATRGLGFSILEVQAPPPKPRKQGTPACRANLDGAGPCVLHRNHRGQHQTRMGDKWG